jgi:osmotically-inducible protein OsmY
MIQIFSNRHRHSFVLSIVALAILGSSLSGCAPLVIGGGAVTAAVASSATEERGFSGFWDDAKIKSQILWHYSREADFLANQVDVVVRQGIVLLTGAVDQPRLKVEAVRLAWKVPGVREVRDEISLENKETMGSYTHDIWITTRVKSALLFEKGIHSSNYNVQTVNGVVYLMGIAPSAGERDRVLFLTRRIDGVKEVVNFVQVGMHQKNENEQPRS